jgi:hypothetical protein
MSISIRLLICGPLPRTPTLKQARGSDGDPADRSCPLSRPVGSEQGRPELAGNALTITRVIAAFLKLTRPSIFTDTGPPAELI